MPGFAIQYPGFPSLHRPDTARLDNLRNPREAAVLKLTGVDFMKTQISSGLFLTLTLTAALALAARTAPAQDATTTASAGQTAPMLSYGVTQIIQLSKAKIGDDTIVNYIRNSGSSYGLDASQIVYLKQQGVSDTVINTMLSQPRVTPAVAPQPVPATAGSTATATATVVTQPAVTYVQPATTYVPASSVYVIPDTQTYNYYSYAYRPYSPCYYSGYYYPCYGPVYYGGGYPAVSLSFGYSGGHWGGYYRGGWHR